MPPSWVRSPDSEDAVSEEVETFIEDKLLTLCVADLFERLAQSERSRSEHMKSKSACRNFRVDVRGTSYFRCRCGHPKAAHAFSPVEKADFVGSAGLKHKVQEVYACARGWWVVRERV